MSEVRLGHIVSPCYKNDQMRAKNIVQQWRALSVPTEDSGSLPSIHMVIHNIYNKFQGICPPLLASTENQA